MLWWFFSSLSPYHLPITEAISSFICFIMTLLSWTASFLIMLFPVLGVPVKSVSLRKSWKAPAWTHSNYMSVFICKITCLLLLSFLLEGAFILMSSRRLCTSQLFHWPPWDIEGFYQAMMGERVLLKGRLEGKRNRKLWYVFQNNIMFFWQVCNKMYNKIVHFRLFVTKLFIVLPPPLFIHSVFTLK